MVTGKGLMINACGVLLLAVIGISLAAGLQEAYTEQDLFLDLIMA